MVVVISKVIKVAKTKGILATREWADRAIKVSLDQARKPVRTMSNDRNVISKIDGIWVIVAMPIATIIAKSLGT